MAKKVEITQKHIECGKRGSTSSCPIALALRESGFRGAFVAWSSWETPSGNFRVLPKKATRFIDTFDAGKRVKPFSFIVRGGA